MGGSSEKNESSSPAFHISMSNFLLGQNPVVLAKPTEESDPASSETSETTSGGWSNASDDEQRVVLVPVECLEDSTTDESFVACEKAKKRHQKEDLSEDDGHVVCQKKKTQEKDGGAGSHKPTKEQVDTSSAAETTSAATDEGEGSDSDASKSKPKKKKAKRDAASEATASTDGTNATDKSGDTSGIIDEASSERESTENMGSTTTDWSISEDALLRGMKEGGESWAEIAKAMQRGKSDVKARWKVVESQPRQDGGDDDETEDQGAQKKGTVKDKSEAKEKGKKETSSEGQKKDEKKNGEGGKKGKQKGKEQAKKKDQADQEKEKSAENVTTLQQKQKKEKKPSPPSSSDSRSSSSDHEDNDFQSQRAYLRNHIHASLYPARLDFEPDAAFSPSDCEVLASVDARRHAGRWLEMQANFYNVTGRWVPLHIMRSKCETAERAKLSDVVAGSGDEGERLVGKVMGWINSVQ